MSCWQSKDVYKNGMFYIFLCFFPTPKVKMPSKSTQKASYFEKEPRGNQRKSPHPSANPSTRGSKLPWLWFDVEWSAPSQSWFPDAWNAFTRFDGSHRVDPWLQNCYTRCKRLVWYGWNLSIHLGNLGDFVAQMDGINGIPIWSHGSTPVG